MTLKVTFFNLPAEVRNHIYGYTFDDSVIALISNRNKTGWKDPQHENEWKEEGRIHSFRHAGKFGSYLVEGTKRAIRLSALSSTANGYAICFASRQTLAESIVFLYRHTKFAFRSQRPFLNFLRVTPASSLSNVSRLHLEILMYGDPREIPHMTFKEKQMKNWLGLWKKASELLPNLRHLKIVAQVNAVPLRFTLSEEWVQPMLQFAACPLTSVEVRLLTTFRPRTILDEELRPPGLVLTVTPNMRPMSLEDRHHAELHRLFENAIERKLLTHGEVEDKEAIREFRKSCRSEYQDFHFPYLLPQQRG
ncbi:hypothetical protein P152DRAFT_455688 [Eremomyces bilateralis CBS 781.70]|uniref:DUF7730 domain-containing protein n=1 Tax=Eremomyces bilateralis CBS 781.70 TaxID=1392243 RepID=A0A6G1GCZ5_9PEZI|nr:uncharacterized protein P152DRAFT_455688 [Eremomyces bilateralis CBS 781.70]KAF1815965.1 hypothetical protein P152DRAFT_455688 [Eremomyces bilateralis CBS 781.70]